MPKTDAENPCFSLELPLCVDSAGRKRLERDFDFGRQLVNATLNTALGRHKQMRQSKKWKAICEMPMGRERSKAFKDLSREYGISSAYDFQKILQAHANSSGRKTQVHPTFKQVLADNLWHGWSEWLFNGAGRPRFKSPKHGLHSLRGKNNRAGIIWKPQLKKVYYAGKLYRVKIDKNDKYAQAALRHPREPRSWRLVKYCILVRKNIRGKTKYFVQIVFEGTPPTKIIPAPKELEVGIDPSMKNMTVVFNNGAAAKVTTSPAIEDQSRKIRRIQRAMDRSRRATNPDNFEANGVPKKGAKVWNRSKGYEKLRQALADILRRRVETRKRDHGKLINIILQSAGHIRVEENSWEHFKNIRFGKAIGEGAPAEFVQRLLNKAERAGLIGIEMNPRKIMPTRCDPLTGEIKKHGLTERRIRLGKTNLFLDRDVAAALNLLFHDPVTGERDAVGEVAFLEAVKPTWLDAGILLEVEDANRMTERELRKVLRNGIGPISVEQLHPKTFLSGGCDVLLAGILRRSSSDLKSSPKKEVPLQDGGLGMAHTAFPE